MQLHVFTDGSYSIMDHYSAYHIVTQNISMRLPTSLHVRAHARTHTRARTHAHTHTHTRTRTHTRTHVKYKESGARKTQRVPVLNRRYGLVIKQFCGIL